MYIIMHRQKQKQGRGGRNNSGQKTENYEKESGDEEVSCIKTLKNQRSD